MKTLKKILICLSLVCCLAVSGVACGNNSEGGNEEDTVSTQSASNDTTDENSGSDEQSADGGNVDDTSSDTDNKTSDTTSANDKSEEVYETEALTDSDGNIVTDADGNTVTQKVLVTAEQPEDNNNASGETTNVQLTVTEEGSSGDNATTENTGLYFAKNRYSTFMWFDMQSDAKFSGSGEIATITFKALNDANAGDYNVELSYIGMFDETANEVKFSAMNSVITIGDVTGGATVQGASASEPVLRLDNATVRAGDTVSIKLYLDNNTSNIAGFQLDLKYDNKALEVQNIEPSGILADKTFDTNLNIDVATVD